MSIYINSWCTLVILLCANFGRSQCIDSLSVNHSNFSLDANQLTGYEKSMILNANSKRNTIFLPQGINHSKKELVFTKYLTKEDTIINFHFKFNPKQKLDKRLNSPVLFSSPSVDFLLLFNTVYSLDYKTNTLNRVLKLKENFQNGFVINDTIYLYKNYFNSQGYFNTIISIDLKTKKTIKQLELDTPDFEFFNILRSNLWASNGKVLAHAEPSKPYISIFDSELKKINEIDLSTIFDWRGKDVLNSSSENILYTSPDPFTRGFAYLENGIHKNLNLCFISENCLQLTFCQGTSKIFSYLIQLNSENQLIDVTICEIDMNTPLFLIGSWVNLGSKFYQIEFNTLQDSNGKLTPNCHVLELEFKNE